MFEAPSNDESVYITALILSLLIVPISKNSDTTFFALATWASIWAMSSKYFLAIRYKHVFNPAAFGVTVTAFAMGLSAFWWVGTAALMPFVLVGGLLMARKTRKLGRSDMVLAFIAVALVTNLGYSFMHGRDLVTSFKEIFLDTPILFFSFVMLTEPMTTPPARIFRIPYGAFVGVLFAPFINLFGIFSTPELALLVGNIFSYLVSPKRKFILTFLRREKIASSTYDFVFITDHKPMFKAGQYLEWNLPHKGYDSRGNRRYFTIASSPTEKDVRIGVKFYPEPSTFKKAMLELKAGDIVVAAQLAGDFTLPADRSKKIVFIAGGIGVTPFRSMIKYMIDTNEKRPLTLFYSNRDIDDIAYVNIFDAARNKLGLRTIYTLTNKEKVPPIWHGVVGMIDEAMLKRELPDYLDRVYYLSGPPSMVDSFEGTLSHMGVRKSHVKTDYFPGYA